MRGFIVISQNKLPKRAFRARLPQNFTEQASKTNVSCEAASKFLRQSFQNERFVRGVLQISQNKLPKRTFRARLPRNFKEQASKTSVSCEASSNFHRTSFKNERFARDFPANFTEQASKTSVSCEASSKFQRTSFQNERFVRGFLKFSQNKLQKRTFRARLPPNFTEQAPKTSVSCEASSNFHRTKLPKRTFRAKPPTISKENLRFATVSCHRPTESYERVHPAKAKCASRYNGVPSTLSKCTFYYYSGVHQNV